MSIYAFYSFEIQEGNKSLFYKETQTKAIDMANVIVGNLLRDEFTVVGKKKKQNQTLKTLKMVEHDNVFTWVLCNVKDIAQYEGHEKTPLESHPGSYIIFDNRPSVCQIAIEMNNAFDCKTDKVVGYLKRAFNTNLSDYGLKMIIKQKYEAGKFKTLVLERIIKHKDSVKKVLWEFPNPDKVKGIDASHEMKGRLDFHATLVKATGALSGKLELKGSKSSPLNIDDDKIEDLGLIIALSAQNNYNLTYFFYNSPALSIKNVEKAAASIDNYIIREFECNQLCDSGNGVTYELIEKLDEIRKQIGGYGNEKIIADGEEA